MEGCRAQNKHAAAPIVSSVNEFRFNKTVGKSWELSAIAHELWQVFITAKRHLWDSKKISSLGKWKEFQFIDIFLFSLPELDFTPNLSQTFNVNQV